MPLSTGSAPFAWAWNTIRAGTAVRASTSELWAEIRGVAADQGYDTGPGLWQAVNEMRSIATAQRSGYERFQRAGMTDTFLADHAAPALNVRSSASRAIQPEYLVTFELTYTNADGQAETRTVAMKDVWVPGMTIGDVYDAVAESAEGMANDYGQGLIGVSNLQPVTI